MEWNPEAFGKRLKALREGIGYSMLAFGKEIGTSASRIKNWEEGKSVPSVSWVVKISDRFGVSLKDLLKGEEQKMYATVLEDTVSPFYGQIAEEKAYYDVGHREEIEELVSKISSLKHRKYAGPEGREEVTAEITKQLKDLTNQDLLEIRTLVQLKSSNRLDGFLIT